MKSKFDSVWIGLVVGIVFPLLALAMFYYSISTKVSLTLFTKHALNLVMLPKMLSLSALPNLGTFFLFIWRNHYFSARGVLMATIFLAFVVLIIKLFF